MVPPLLARAKPGLLGVRAVTFSFLCPTIRETRDFNREKHGTKVSPCSGKAPSGRPFHPGVSYLAVPTDIEAKHPLPDTQIAERAVATLEGFDAPGNLSAGQQFFLGVGFHRPVGFDPCTWRCPFRSRLLLKYPGVGIGIYILKTILPTFFYFSELTIYIISVFCIKNVTG
eukprot:SAG31_NODE_734_length_12489_cov_6.922034_4_plen_171_part_00